MELMARHYLRVGSAEEASLTDEQLDDVAQRGRLREQIEPWLSAIFQSEHLGLLLGSGFSAGVVAGVGDGAATMDCGEFGGEFEADIREYANASASRMGRGSANFEDRIRAALQLRDGLRVMGDERVAPLVDEIDAAMKSFLQSILGSERALVEAKSEPRHKAEERLVSFLMSFASRTPTRERLEVFTTNYDRFVEYGCDLGGLHVLDRFVGGLSPLFRSSRLSVDVHYNPPGIRGEPRYLEGVVRVSKLHGSLDWAWDEASRELRRVPLPFGGENSEVADKPSDTVMIYPNPAKDMETLEYPYADLFRDFAAAVCRPNTSLVTYGYGFGDDHINRVIRDMLTIPSTHLVVLAWDRLQGEAEEEAGAGARERIVRFCEGVGRRAQVSLLLGPHLGDMGHLTRYYLPKPAIDKISARRAELLERRGECVRSAGGGGTDEHAD